MAPGAYSLLAVPARPAGAGPALPVVLMPLTIVAVHSQRSGHRATLTRTFAPTTRGVVVFFTLVPVAEAEITGALPKAASLHDLRCAGCGGPLVVRSRSMCSRYPFTTPRGTSRATFRHSLAPSAASTTKVTSL